MGDLGLGIGCFFVIQFKQTCAESFLYAFKGRYMMIYDGYCNMQVTVVCVNLHVCHVCHVLKSLCVFSVGGGLSVWIELERDRCWPTSWHNMHTSLSLSQSCSTSSYSSDEFAWPKGNYPIGSQKKMSFSTILVPLINIKKHNQTFLGQRFAPRTFV